MANVAALHPSDFEAALASYLDESKPDPLARRQIENVIVQWEQSTDTSSTAADLLAASSTESSSSDASSDTRGNGGAETKRIDGRLTLIGEYMSVTLDANCKWTWLPSHCLDDSVTTNAGASLSFRLSVSSASFIPLTQYKRLQKERDKRASSNQSDGDNCVRESDANADRKQQKAQAKVRSRMVDRLKKDPYVKKLLDTASATSSLSISDNGGDIARKQITLFAAEIHQSFDSRGKVEDMEERVDINEDGVEGVRRAMFSQLEDNTSVVELLLSLPFLPKDVETKQDNGHPIELQLGHRAVLRLLEDAMVDACEKEGEDEMLDDLVISGNDDKDDDLSDGDCEPRPRTKFTKKISRR